MSDPARAGGRDALAAAWAEWLEEALEDRVLAAEDVSSPWGSTRTWRVRLQGHRVVALQASADGAAMERRRRVASRMVTSAPSLGVARPLAWRQVDGRHVLASEWIPGTRATRLLGSAADAARLAVAMGRAAAKIRSVPVHGLGLSTTWTDPATLEAELEGWLATVREGMPSGTWRERQAALPAVAAAAASGPAVLAHGDLVPVNLLVDGPRVAILDLEAARSAPPAFDIARAGAVIGRYHPAAWRAMEGPLLEAAAIPRNHETAAQLGAMAAALALESAADAVRTGEDARRVAETIDDEPSWGRVGALRAPGFSVPASSAASRRPR